MSNASTEASAGTSADTPISWEDIFEPDEVLLWQGRPDPSFAWQKRHILPVILGLGVACLGILWIFFTPLGNGYTVIMGLVLLLLAAFLAIAPPVMAAMVRKASWYSLSNKRGYIAMHRPNLGRKLAAYPIDPDFELKFDAKTPATIIFAMAVRKTGSVSDPVKISFDLIEDGQKVYDLMRKIQRDEI
ncbi:hypothetical protein JI58_09175 [Marinosulfonomonas sp. PRT-SC04]|nr:hypothetical protein JI58_09175 [Marinosulfonomonas sp. PRT-SC04]